MLSSTLDKRRCKNFILQKDKTLPKEIKKLNKWFGRQYCCDDNTPQNDLQSVAIPMRIPGDPFCKKLTS